MAPQGRDHWDKMGMRPALEALRSRPARRAIMRRACPYCGENSGPGKDRRMESSFGPDMKQNAFPSFRFTCAA